MILYSFLTLNFLLTIFLIFQNQYLMKKLKLILIGETQDVKDAIVALNAKGTALATAIESLITLTKSVQSQLASIGGATSDPATVSDLQSLSNLIDAETANIQTELATAVPPTPQP